MSAHRAPLRQSDLTRYAKAMDAAGVSEWRVIVRPDGTQEIVAGKTVAKPDESGWEDLT